MQNCTQTSLKKYNSFGIDIISKKFFCANSKNELKEILEKIKDTPFILGEGTNILFKKEIERSIIKIGIKGIEIVDEDKDFIFVRVGAGENWDDLVNWAVNNDYGGLENLSLIPGSVGSAPVQNIGAYGVEISDSLTFCETISISNFHDFKFKNEDCKFSYRSSIFKEELKGHYVICYVNFRLTKKNHRINFSYRPLQEILSKNRIKTPTIKEISKFVKKIRKSKLPDPKKLGNCGSFFQNPVLSFDEFEELKKKDHSVPSYYMSDNRVKIPAAYLIEKCGLKGIKKGNVGTFKKHALIIVNYGNASGEEIFDFSTMIKDYVLRKFNILLKEEVNIINQ